MKIVHLKSLISVEWGRTRSLEDKKIYPLMYSGIFSTQITRA